jgi:two-component system, NarL family, nitrate/nitrite response regulator NarL
MTPTQVLVADPVAIFRTGVRNLLTREGDFEVLEAESLDEIASLTSACTPAISLIDLDLPPSGGISAASWLASACPTHTIVWSFTPSGQTVLSALRAGASGYLHKEISPRGLVRALRGIIAGEAPLARDLAALMIDRLHGLERRASAREQATTLSEREREVLRLIATGARNKQIASQLTISEFTVKRHVQNILQKLHLSSRHAAAGFYKEAFSEDGMPEALSQPA